MNYTITTRRTKTGIAFDLYVRWKGKRYRPLLGYNLTQEDADLRAIAMIAKVQRDELTASTAPSACPTLREFAPTYWQTMRIKGRVDLRRPASILDTHLLPQFGDRPLDSLRPEDGLHYVAARLAAHAAPGTIHREFQVLLRILNLAVDFERLDRNRLKRVQLPDAHARDRVATTEELAAIQALAPPELWRLAHLALHTGLRESKLLEIEWSWMKLRDDGWWLLLPPARTALKGTPKEIPLNRHALAALRTQGPSLDGPVFRRWNSPALTMSWRRCCKQARVQDLHFHDLRHTFATRLQNLGVPLEVRSALLGHRLHASMTSRYSHGGHGWNQQLRDAVTRLEPTNLSYETSYSRPLDLPFALPLAANSPEDHGKVRGARQEPDTRLSLSQALLLSVGLGRDLS